MYMRRYCDKCYALCVGNRRGPVGHSCVKAWERFIRSGFVAFAGQHG